MNQYKICEVCGIKYFDDPTKKRGRKKKYPVCSPSCRDKYVRKMKAEEPTDEDLKKIDILRCLDAIFPEEESIIDEASPEISTVKAARKAASLKAPEEGFPELKSTDYRCHRADCRYRQRISGGYICDYLGLTGHARSLICTVEDCTVYEPGIHPKTRNVPEEGDY